MYSASELRVHTVDELNEMVIDLRRKQLDIRIQASTGQYADVSKFKEYRRDIARIKTVLNEKKDN